MFPRPSKMSGAILQEVLYFGQNTIFQHLWSGIFESASQTATPRKVLCEMEEASSVRRQGN